MKRELYTVTDFDGAEICKVMATGHRQHIWNVTKLIGVSESGAKKLEAAKAHGPIYVDAGQYRPLLSGWEIAR